MLRAAPVCCRRISPRPRSAGSCVTAPPTLTLSNNVRHPLTLSSPPRRRGSRAAGQELLPLDSRFRGNDEIIAARDAMARMTGGGALVEMLRRNGVDTIFALPGVQNDALFVAFYDAGEALRVIHTRHEQGAAYMAYGYARSSGKVGAYDVVPGPGLLNTTAALATAYATNTPVLCISGQIPCDLIGRGFGLLHEIPDQLGILRTLTKWAARISHPTQAGQLANEAFRQLRDGRPRPVALEMPLDVMALETEITLPDPEPALPPPPPDGEHIDKAAALLAGAKKPLLFVGGGAIGAAEEVLAIAEVLEAPVVSYTGGKGIVSDRHYLAQSALARHELWREADVVLAVGTRIHQPQVRWGIDVDLQLLRLDMHPT